MRKPAAKGLRHEHTNASHAVATCHKRHRRLTSKISSEHRDTSQRTRDAAAANAAGYQPGAAAAAAAASAFAQPTWSRMPQQVLQRKAAPPYPSTEPPSFCCASGKCSRRSDSSARSDSKSNVCHYLTTAGGNGSFKGVLQGWGEW